MNYAHWLVAIALAVWTAMPSPAGAAGEPPGMVMKLTGDTVPPLREHQEIPADTAVKLAPGTSLTFVHYQKCKRVTITGGTLTLSEGDYALDGGTVDSEKNFPCPPVRHIAAAGDSAAVVSRGISPRFPLNAEFIFTGRHAGAITSAEIYLDDSGEPGEPVSRLVLAEDHASLPGAPALKPNKRYMLKVETSSRTAPIEVKFISGQPAEDSLVVLRID